MNSLAVRSERPTPVLKKSIKINFKEFGSAIAKLTAQAAVGKWDDIPESGVEVLASLGISAGIGEIAWVLINRAVVRAYRELVNESFGTSGEEYHYASLLGRTHAALEETAVTINRKFFERPEEEPALALLSRLLVQWLSEQGLDVNSAEAIGQRLPAYFAMALHDEWASSPQDYAVLREHIDTPFTSATDRLQRWALYRTWLLKQVEAPMFNESFSLKNVFVTPRAYYARKSNRKSVDHIDGRVSDIHSQRVVVDLQKCLEDWIRKSDKDDAVRLISGGPGSGKSSFAKIFAASLAARQDLYVLFIPLHHFEPTADLIDAVGKFVQADGFLLSNPLKADQREGKLVIIFDGLDELAMQGKIAERTAQDFIREVLRKTERMNQQKTFIQAIISGRELIVQQSESDFRKEGQILHLLPYYVEKKERHYFFDKNDLLALDQREVWWKKYGIASGQGYSSVPLELKNGFLVDITSQPLLNYLVALSLKRGELKFSEETNLNAVYADLLKAIYERGWSSNQHASIQGISEADFYRVLEEIALSTWHGDGRKTTVRDIENHCENSGLQALLNRFQSGLQENSTAKVTQLLTAFYFRQSGQNVSGERTFEFTHKSFGEYLTARRIIRELKLINRQLRARETEPDIAWEENECLRRWVILFGSSAIDEYLMKFIRDEIRLAFKEAPALVDEFQGSLAHLFGFVLRNGMPMERQSPRARFKEEYRRARNAEEALMICLNGCARVTRKITKIEWPSETAFGDWLAKTRGQVRDWAHLPILSCLSYLDMSGLILNAQFLWHADLSYSDMRETNFVGAELRYAKIVGANLERAIFAYSSLVGIDFSRARLKGAEFPGARLVDTGIGDLPDGTFGQRLEGPNFYRADLRSADFDLCDLRRANFKKARLDDASFDDAILEGADFTDTIIDSSGF